jgi:hypothetical protein
MFEYGFSFLMWGLFLGGFFLGIGLCYALSLLLFIAKVDQKTQSLSWAYLCLNILTLGIVGRIAKMQELVYQDGVEHGRNHLLLSAKPHLDDRAMHDIRKPLSIVRALFRCLKADLRPEVVKKLVAESQAEFERAAEAVEKLLSGRESSAGQEVAKREPLKIGGSKPVVLVVDDNIYVYEDWKNHFCDFDFIRVDIVENFADLVADITKLKFDCLLLDYYFDNREFTGVDVLRELVKNNITQFKTYLITNANFELSSELSQLGILAVAGKDPLKFELKV